MINNFPISVGTLESDLNVATVDICVKLGIDPSQRIALRDGSTVRQRSAGELIGDALHYSAIGVLRGSDFTIWQSAEEPR